MQLTEAVLAFTATLMTLFCAVRAFKAFAVHDIPAACVAAGGGLLVSPVALHPALFVELTDRLQEKLWDEVASSASRPARGTPRPGADGETFTLPWAAIGHALCILVGAAVLLLAGTALTAQVRRRRARQLRRKALERRHDTVLDAYGDFQVNLLDNLDRLALADVAVPHTARLVDALDAARDARIPTGPESLEAYRKAVTALETAWTAADHHARVQGADYLPHDDRRRIKQAQAALSVAADEHGYLPQRQLALRRALQLVETVLPVPRTAVASLETATRLSLDKA